MPWAGSPRKDALQDWQSAGSTVTGTSIFPRGEKNGSATVRPVYMRAAAAIRVSLGIWIPTARIESSARRSTRIWTLSGSIVTWRPTTARISSRSTAMRSVWLTKLRSYSSRICSRSRATGAELFGRRKRNSLKRGPPPEQLGEQAPPLGRDRHFHLFAGEPAGGVEIGARGRAVPPTDGHRCAEIGGAQYLLVLRDDPEQGDRQDLKHVLDIEHLAAGSALRIEPGNQEVFHHALAELGLQRLGIEEADDAVGVADRGDFR